jgi:hypothetical protein
MRGGKQREQLGRSDDESAVAAGLRGCDGG